MQIKQFFEGLTPNNFFAGLIVAVVALPLCIAFAIASGAHPMAGVVSGVLGGAIAAAAGSSRFQVSGPAAAFITILYGVVAAQGFAGLLAATLVAGAVVLALGVLRLGRLMHVMPHSVIVGFTCGIGVLIVCSQLPVALGIEAKGADAMAKLAYTARHLAETSPAELAVMLGTLAATLGFARTRAARRVPAPLFALAFGGLAAQLAQAAGMPVRTIGALYDISLDGLAFDVGFLARLVESPLPVLQAGVTLGVLIAVESLLAAKALDAMSNTTHDPDRELIGLGLANLAVPFAGGIPVSGVIVRGSTNVMSGASSRSAALLHAVFLALFVALLYPLIGALPLAALAAVLMLTARRLIELHELRRIVRIDRWEGGLAVLTALLTVTVDLTVSVPVGVALMIVLALRRLATERRVDVLTRDGAEVVAPACSMTFLSAPGVKAELARLLGRARVKALDLAGVHYIDATGATVLAELMAAHPEVAVWVATPRGDALLRAAGVPGERITLRGSALVDLPAVYRRLELGRA